METEFVKGKMYHLCICILDSDPRQNVTWD